MFEYDLSLLFMKGDQTPIFSDCACTAIIIDSNLHHEHKKKNGSLPEAKKSNQCVFYQSYNHNLAKGLIYSVHSNQKKNKCVALSLYLISKVSVECLSVCRLDFVIVLL